MPHTMMPRTAAFSSVRIPLAPLRHEGHKLFNYEPPRTGVSRWGFEPVFCRPANLSTTNQRAITNASGSCDACSPSISGNRSASENTIPKGKEFVRQTSP